MTSRMALGSVSTLAVGAMLLGAMPYIVSRSLGSSHTGPWGALSSLHMGTGADAAGGTAPVSEADRTQLLKLASLKTSPVLPAPAPMAAAASTDPALSGGNWQGTLQKVATAEPAAVLGQSQQVQADMIAATAQSGTDAAEDVAALEPPSPAPKPNAARAGASSGAVNINTASMDTLDRLPGVGRIGHAIMVHRPYRSVADLVKKRVLRTSDYAKIQSRIRVD